VKSLLSPRVSRLTVALAISPLMALGLVACGGDDKSDTAKGNPSEAAFLQAMIPHHESAVEMAKIARRRGQHGEIKTLARNIERTQSEEITQMESVYRRLFGKAIAPDPAAHDELGLSAAEAGAEHSDVSKLDRARPFDRAFIDEMVPHHQGAIRMAAAVQSRTDNVELEQLAGSIIETQAQEIRQMNAWRKKWYGSPSPAGGPPPVGEDAPTESGGGAGHSSGH
jgi:uncharacterized protein (DUF305 family)